MNRTKWARQILAMGLCLVMALFPAPVYAKAAETSANALRGEASADDFDIEGGVLTYYTGEDSEVTIPSSVTSIGEGAFAWCDSLTKVTIPSSVTSIGGSAFFACTSLTEITIPSSVTSIGEYAFDSCWSLTEITIPSSVTSIGNRAFQGCESLKEITIPQSVTDLGECVFLGTAWLGARMAENPLVVVNGILIDGTTCSGSADIPDDVTDISAWAFSENDSLTSVTIPPSVMIIGDVAFWECNNLTEVTIPSSVSNIGEETFYGCDKLETVTLREGVTTIGNCAFGSCENLRTANIPPSVTSIADDAFDGSSWVAFYGEEGSYAQEYAEAHNIPFNHPVKNVISACKITFSASTYTYNGKAKTPAVTVQDGDGALSGADYTVTYENNINAGTDAKVIITGKGDYSGSVTKTFTIKKAGQTISCAKAYSKTYGGKAFTVNAERTAGNGKLTYKSSNSKVASVDGKGKVTLKGAGIATITVKAAATANYNARSVAITITVNPAKQTVKSLKTVKGKKLTVSWKKDAQATGYQIQYSTDKKLQTDVKTATVTNNTATLKSLTKLTAGKKYYVRVRSYKTVKVNGRSKKLYGVWSSAKQSESIKK